MKRSLGDNLSKSKLFKFALFLWGSLIFLTGTHFRDVQRTSVGIPKFDFLIQAQVLIAFIGGCVGLILIYKNKRKGKGIRALYFYIAVAFLSSLFSDYSFLTVGYAALLAGAIILSIGCVNSLQNFRDVQKMESILFFLIAVMLFKDVVLAGFFLNSPTDGGFVGRLGYGTVHPNKLGAVAAVLFWLSFRKSSGFKKWFLHLLKIFLVVIILLTKSRTVMLVFFISGVVRLFYRLSTGKKERVGNLKVLVFSFSACLVLTWILLFSFGVSFAEKSFDFFGRGQSLAEVQTLTQRTEIWGTVIDMVSEEPTIFSFGSGYGVSRLVLKDWFKHPYYEPPTVHNAFLEFFLSMGIPGVLVFLMIIGYSLNWFFKFKDLQSHEIKIFFLRVIPIISMEIMSSFTESTFGTKITSSTLMFFFFLLILDRKDILYKENRDK